MPSLPDPSAPAPPDSGLYGLDTPLEEAGAAVIPVPFDATCSYRRAAADAPAAILLASHQVELFDAAFGSPFEAGIAGMEVDPRLHELNAEARSLVDALSDCSPPEALQEQRGQLDALCDEVRERVRTMTAQVFDRGGLPAILGGDHSAPFGAWEAAAERHPGMGLLQFDAHADLREAYQGHTWSHASVMHNALERLDSVSRLVQVGLRDLCPEELQRIEDAGERVFALHYHEWACARLQGRDLTTLVRSTLAHLPDEVWISFDIDGLDPSLCPGTGTPVPGGLSWDEAALWLQELIASGKRVIGVDLVEVAPGPAPTGSDSWDAVIGARLLYRLLATGLAQRLKGPPPSRS